MRKRSWPAVSHCVRAELRSGGAASCRRPRRSSSSAWREGYEVDADGVVEGSGEVVLHVPHQHARFAHPRVADYQHLQQLRVAEEGQTYLSGLLYCIIQCLIILGTCTPIKSIAGGGMELGDGRRGDGGSSVLVTAAEGKM